MIDVSGVPEPHAAGMYRRLRQALAADRLSLRTEAEHVAMAYLSEVSARTLP